MLFRKRKQAAPALPDDAPALLALSKAEHDPKKRHELLERALQIAPDSLDVRRAVLLAGRAHLCPHGEIDYSCLKCYLLNAFEHPEKYGEKQREQMARELFDAPELKACLELTDKKDAFMTEYLDALCRDYARIFIEGEANHKPGLFGLYSPAKLPEYLAKPAGDVLINLFDCPYLSQDERRLVAGRFYRAYGMIVGGRLEPLDARLGAERCALLE